jgi:two-component system, chemotaxis family, sensor kinase CheA
MDGMEEIIKEFVVESREGLDQVDRDLVELEKLPDDMERVARIFRAIHTLKGTSGVLGFRQLESIAHVGENLLSRLRDRTLTFNRPIVDSLLELVDASRILLTDVEQKGAESERDCITVISSLKKQLETFNAAEPATTNIPSSATESRRDSQITAADAQISSTIRVDVGLIDKVMTLVGELVLARNQVLQLTSSEKEQGLVKAAQRLNLICTNSSTTLTFEPSSTPCSRPPSPSLPPGVPTIASPLAVVAVIRLLPILFSPPGLGNIASCICPTCWACV